MFASIASGWMPASALGVFLVAMIAAEALFPIHRLPVEPKGRLIANFGLGIVNAGLFATLPLSSVIAATWAQQGGVGLFNLLAMPVPLAFAATIVLRSLIAYGLHVAAHRIPLLWRMHRVHHGARRAARRARR